MYEALMDLDFDHLIVIREQFSTYYAWSIFQMNDFILPDPFIENDW
jgi:hypothetical protein